MSDTYNYPVEVERDEDGRYVVAFPDFDWGATDGATLDEALAEARDLLRELIAATMRAGEDLDIAESEMRRMLNPDHATKAATIDRALRRLGKRVSVTVGEAA